MSERYSADVRMWIELPSEYKGRKKHLEVASVGNGSGVLVGVQNYLLQIGDRLGDLCIQVDETLKRYPVKFETADDDPKGFKYEKLEKLK